MRDIVFRGKTVEGEAWICGDLRQYSENVTGIKPHKMPHTMRVIPGTVGQYIGLTDKNGRRIFEGDIIHLRCGYYESVGKVIYSDNNTRFGIADARGEMNFSFLNKPFVKQFAIEVIGNIYDTPELFKEANNA